MTYNLKKALFLGVALTLSSCQSTAIPEWVTQPNVETNEHYFVVGQGRNILQAQNNALSQITKRLWTQVESSSYSRNILRQTNSDENFQSLNDLKIKTKTAPVILSGAHFTKSKKIDEYTYYVEAKISKSDIAYQLERELNEIEAEAKRQLHALSSTDPLVWWLRNRNVNQVRANALTRSTMLAAVSEQPSLTWMPVVNELQRKVDAVKASTVIYIKGSKRDKWMIKMLANQLSQEGISTTSSPATQYSHEIIFDTDWRQQYLMEAYITTVSANLLTRSKNSSVLGSHEVIATGNSVSSYKMAQEGAARHFSHQLEEQGVWVALGIN
ncbi:hypothetical protein BIT28_06380 [Photobacterium proteolyticum]|uniref:LPP20 lipoprotein n=1 Tax=Photobacterium proteolyticum TaxID=1903952 RepID=A0A1Q9GEI8_9GAMM|nr:LPP20 family lipoprotein [Photobacterium proteolyticum]OLQ72811.1 hypothetical protein BIT28_06380 [Photobacterium proteolyticum]